MAKMLNNNQGGRLQRSQQQPQQEIPQPSPREQQPRYVNIHNHERYARLAILCLVLIFIVAAVRILGKKDD